MLDVGHNATAGAAWSGSQYGLRKIKPDLFRELIGEHFESLHNLNNPPISLKLKSPQMQYIVRDWNRLSPIISNTFGGVLSLAKGGLASGWGAGVYRFNARDLRGFPIGEEDLRESYNDVESHIGVCGANDDLEPYFGGDTALLPPLPLTDFYARFLTHYQRARPQFKREGAAVGHSRLAVLTEPRNGRAAYEYGNLEFFRPRDPAIYNPAYTVEEMVRAGAVDYRAGMLALHYRETESCVEVTCRNLSTGSEEVFRGRRLALGAGAFNTARIVLASNRDYETRLPILDNPMACVPFFELSRIGAAAPERDTSLAQLNLVMEDGEWDEPLQGSLYGASGPLRSDALFSLPFSIRANMAWTRHLAPAMGMAILFYPGVESPRNSLRLRSTGELEVQFDPVPPQSAERRLLKLFRSLRYVTAAALIQRPAMGAGLHFAGPLPMRVSPTRYETDRNGRLFDTRSVYIVDGACFTRLPAKNLTFTIMANALRIGRHIAAELA